MSGILISFLDHVDTICEQFVFSGYQALAQAYAPAIYGLVALAVVVFGYLLLTGRIELSLRESATRILIIGFILALALNWDVFASFIYSLFTEAPNQIASHLVQAIPGSHYSDQSSVNSALQQTFYEGIKFASSTWERGSLNNLLPYLWSLLLFFLAFAIAGFALLELVVAKFGLAIYLVLAPIIIPTFLFQATKTALFDGWLRHLIGFALIPIYVTAAITLAVMLIASYSSELKNNIQNDVVNVTNLVPYIICGLINIGLIKRATSMATSMAGGISTSMSQGLHNFAKATGGYIKDFFKGTPEAGNTNINFQGDAAHFQIHDSKVNMTSNDSSTPKSNQPNK